MKAKIFLSITIGMLFTVWGCKKEDDLLIREESEQNSLMQNESLHSNHSKFTGLCLGFDTSYCISENRINDRTHVLNGNTWMPGSTLRVKFLNGTSTQQSLIKAIIQEWVKFANINIVWINTGDSEIRILIDSAGGYWSYHGVDALGVPQNEPTMHFKTAMFSNNSTLKSKVFHEFGHALGLIHEHQNPNVYIPWNETAAVAWYQGNYGIADVYNQVINKIGYWWNTTQNGWDAQSVMTYQIPYSVLQGYGNQSGNWVNENSNLSSMNKQFIEELYPFPSVSYNSFYSFSSHNFPSMYIRHSNFSAYINTIYSWVDKLDATFKLVAPKDTNCPKGISLESKNFPGYYLINDNGVLKLSNSSGNFNKKATFILRGGLADASKISFESWLERGKYLRHQFGQLFIHGFDNSNAQLFKNDATFALQTPWAN